MPSSPPRRVALKAAISALDVVAACEVGFAAVLSLGSLSDSTVDYIGDGYRGSGNGGLAVITGLLCITALLGLAFALETWCAGTVLTPGKNAIFFVVAAIAAIVVAAVGGAEAPFVVLVALPPLLGCGLCVHHRALLKRDQPNAGNAEASLIRELLASDNPRTAYRGQVAGFLRVAHPTARAESPATASQKASTPVSTADHKA